MFSLLQRVLIITACSHYYRVSSLVQRVLIISAYPQHHKKVQRVLSITACPHYYGEVSVPSMARLIKYSVFSLQRVLIITVR